MSDVPVVTLDPIIEGRATGCLDRNGQPLLDGDFVDSFNMFADGERWEDIKNGRSSKRPVRCQIRRTRWNTGNENWSTVMVPYTETRHRLTGLGRTSDELVEKVFTHSQEETANA